MAAIGIGIFAFLWSVILPDGYAWGACIAASAAALVFPAVFYYRAFAVRRQFWVTVLVLSLVQVPVVIAIKPIVDEGRFPFILLFGALDCIAVIIVLSKASAATSQRI
jgi:hypothetical protein